MTLNEWLWIPTQSESESSPWVVAMSGYLGHQSGLFVIMALHNWKPSLSFTRADTEFRSARLFISPHIISYSSGHCNYQQIGTSNKSNNNHNV